VHTMMECSDSAAVAHTAESASGPPLYALSEVPCDAALSREEAVISAVLESVGQSQRLFGMKALAGTLLLLMCP
jgi:hypothetical protein